MDPVFQNRMDGLVMIREENEVNKKQPLID